MTRAEQQLFQKFMNRANSYERSNADGPGQVVNPAATVLGAQKGNPAFVAQFDIQFLLQYFTIVDATGVWTASNAAAIVGAVPALGTKLPAFLFGNSDFSSGFAKLRQQFPLNGGWVYSTPFIYGKDEVTVNGHALDASAIAGLQLGDLVIPVYYDGGATTYVGFTVVRCTQVGYGALLDALNSDRFAINMIRYILADTTAIGLAQYNNNINIVKMSLFGKSENDFVSPNSMKMPEQMQNGIIDIPLEKGVDKQVALATMINYDVVVVQWSVFVNLIDKLAF